jgi:hypothetical protein
MHPDDAVDRTIRNQRCGRWPAWVWIVSWALLWVTAFVTAELCTQPGRWRAVVFTTVAIVMLASLVFLLVALDRWQPTRRLKLGDELHAFPVRRVEPADIRAIRLAPDPDEDYVEAKLPVPYCQVTVDPRRGRPIQLVVSAGDAARLREWAERKGIAVIDPEGYSTREVRNGPSEVTLARGCQADRGVRR